MPVPKERDSYGIGLPTRNLFGSINPLQLGPMMAPVELQQPDLLPLLQEVPEEIRGRIVQAMQQTYKINSDRFREYHVKVDLAYKTCY